MTTLSTVPFSKLLKPLNDYSLVCRGCLSESGEMKNMVEWKLLEDYFKCTGVKIKTTDDVSMLICSSCEKLLMTAREFRQRCQKSHMMLYKAKKDANPHVSVDQQHNMITSSLQDDKLILSIMAPNIDSKIQLFCPFQCHRSFTKKSDLNGHLIRRHNKEPNFDVEVQFHCSYQDCRYHCNKSFSGRKFLNQHILKVHREKVYHCDHCSVSYATQTELDRHLKHCNTVFICSVCGIGYRSNETYLVHLKRKHPDHHELYKLNKVGSKKGKRKRNEVAEFESKRAKLEEDGKILDFMCDSPKRSYGTQTAQDTVRNDVSLSFASKFDAKTDEISTQTMLEMMSLKSQNSEDDSYISFSETVSLSDIQTQTLPLEFGLCRSDKVTETSETKLPDSSIKETQTCVCLYDTKGKFDSRTSSPYTASAETQTLSESDFLPNLHTAETQTCFDDEVIHYFKKRVP